MKYLKHHLATLAMITAVGGNAWAAGGHDHGAHDHGGHDGHQSSRVSMDHDNMKHSNMFLVEKSVDGYKVSFHVMEANKGMEHGGSHNFMVKIERDGKEVSGVKINSKVIHPNDKAETKPLMKMGGWYMNGYDLGHAGKHQLMILFKTADGKKHKAGVYYP